MTAVVNLADFRRRARRRLPKMVFDYLEGGADDERGLERNPDAFGRILFNPHRLQDVSTVDCGSTWLGTRRALPMAIAPIGLAGAMWADGDVALARAAAGAGIPLILSTAATTSVEEVVRRGGGEVWFQLYVVQRALADQLVDRALAAGCTALVLTVDVPVNGKRERDLRNGFTVPFRPTPGAIVDFARHPAWTWQQLRHGLPQLAHMSGPGSRDVAAQAALMRRQMDASFNWTDLARLRERWPRLLIVKGVLNADDAARCFDAGADAVVLSNHGGRQLADFAAPIEILAEIRSRAGERTLLLDSGVRTGTDVVKAVALGANAVMLGRAALYGLAAAGEAGVREVIAMVAADIERTLALIGCASLDKLTSAYVRRTPA